LTGIQTDEVQVAPASDLMRVPGRITVDESRLFRIIAAADGWIVKMGKNFAGTAVKRNEILASYYTPNMIVSQQNLLYALGRSDQLQKTDVVLSIQRASLPLNLESALDTVRSLGMNDIQIQEIQRTRQYASEIFIYSPVAGYVISRNVSPEQRFDKGAELYGIADINHVWVLTDIFEKDREFLDPGTMATVNYRGRKLHARKTNVLPRFDTQSRTLKTLFEVANPDSILLPDMFVDVELQVEKPAALTVPVDAVVDSGRRKTVYVERASGVFEPRMVETGWRLGDRIQIINGLKPGERIVVSGNFLIDSESRMKLAAKTSAALEDEKNMVKDLVCGMDVDPESPTTRRTQYKGKTYYFCAEMCKKSFEAHPEKYTQKAALAEAETAKDPVCGMDVDPKSPDTLKTQYRGETYYFCAEACKKSFETNPGKYIHKAMAAQSPHRTMHSPE
jgi:Cu(I)/Ag(I) efflux system membrane fusion protein